MQYLVYKVTFPNNKVYIGITTQSFEERKRKHYVRLKSNCKFKFYNALKKYADKVKWTILDSTAKNKRDLCKLEEFYINKYNSYYAGYNSTLGGELNLGRKVTEKTRNKLRLLNLGSNNPNYGKQKSLESRIKCAISNGTKPFNVYKKDTQEFIGTWYIKKQCAKELNLNYQAISKCLNHKYKYHKDYIFKYTEETSHAKV